MNNKKYSEIRNVYHTIEIEYGIQVVFSTIPSKGSNKFIKDIDNNYFKAYKKNLKKNKNIDTNSLYTPLKYYMLGDYDVCFITLINNFSFSHRLFESINETNNNYHNTHTFQSYTGFALNKTKELNNFFRNRVHELVQPDEYFIGVINLKLNNGLLIGTGVLFIETVFKYIEDLMVKRKNDNILYTVSQTFSWFELSLIILFDNPDKMKNILTELRGSTLKNLFNSDIVANSSFYHTLFNNTDNTHISLFSDIHSFFGFNEKLITTQKNGDIGVENFKKHISKNDITLTTQIEWQIKPGHILKIEDILKNRTELKGFINFSKKKFLLGKSDYVLNDKQDNILCNFNLLRFVYSAESEELFKYIRKVRSYVYLDASDIINTTEKKEKYISWEKELEKLAFTPKNFNTINKKLKALKISRQVRVKILKLFSNYNHGIQDPILFTYFIDFTIFIENLVKLIYKDYRELKNSKRINDLEIRYIKHIDVFQESYNVRFLNSYQFENISDFDLDFNSSIQQLLSSYGTLIYEMGKLFYMKSKNEISPIIQLNNIDTVSNYLSINYSIYHLTSPEFVFTTLLKEFLNNLKLDNVDVRNLLQDYNSKIKTIKEVINDSYFDDMLDLKQIKMDYFIIDSIRFIITFNNDFSLFQYWFWSYDFQNSSLFDSCGMFNEDHLKVEMFRIMLIYHMFKINENVKLKCPTPELFTLWDRHYNKINDLAKKFISSIKDIPFTKTINNITELYLSSYDSNKDNPDLDLNEIRQYIDNNSILYNEEIFPKKIAFLLDKNSSNNKIHQMEKLIFKTLNILYEKNNRSLTTLKRNWNNGNKMPAYNILYKKSIYALDQTGGVSFYDISKANNYFRISALNLLKIIDFSLKNKKEFIIKRIKNRP